MRLRPNPALRWKVAHTWAIVLATVTAVVVVLAAFAEALHHDEHAIVGLSSQVLESERKAPEAAADAGGPDAQSRLAHEISPIKHPFAIADLPYLLSAPLDASVLYDRASP